MTTHGWSWCWKLGLASALVVDGVILASDCVFAQSKIIPDNTLPTNSRVTSLDNLGFAVDQIDQGTIRGTNLFHSFREFSVSEGRGAYFTNPDGIENILSRVTGNDPSNILGTLGVIGNANLFLMNPNGVIFGEKASLDVGGSFVATTANAIQLGNAGQFSASEPTTRNLLKVNPSALFFNALASQAEIVNRSTLPGLQVPNGQSLLLAGGNVSLDGGALFALGGRVELGGVARSGTVGLDVDGSNLRLSFPDEVTRSDISLSNEAVVGVFAGGGGSIAVNARNLDISGGSSLYGGIVQSSGLVGGQAGDIEINATDKVTMRGLSSTGRSSTVGNNVTESTGDGGDINIRAGSLLLTDGAQLNAVNVGEGKPGNISIDVQDAVTFAGTSSNGVTSGISSGVLPEARGNSGNISINTKKLIIRDGANIDANTYSVGIGGTLDIKASDFVEVIGTSADGEFASYLSSTAFGSGNAGKLSIETGQLTIQDGAAITAGTAGRGSGGTLDLRASDFVEVIGTSADGEFISGLYFSTLGSGAAGNLSIDTKQLIVQDRAFISTDTSSTGDAGDIIIRASDSVEVSERGILRAGVREGGKGAGGNLSIETGQLNVQGKASILVDTEGSGAAGDLKINTGRLIVQDGAFITARTFGDGLGGTLTVNAFDSVRVIGTDADGFPSGLSTKTNGAGAAGTLSIKTGRLTVQDGALVSTDTNGQGRGGTLDVTASESIEVIGTSPDGSSSSFFTDTEGSGAAGDLKINTGRLIVQDGAFITARTFGDGLGGTLTVNASDSVKVTGADTDGFSSALSTGTEGVGDAGALSIKTGRLTVQDGALVSTDTSGAGNAGSLTINVSDLVELRGIGTGANGSRSGLYAQVNSSATGSGGNLTINTGKLLLLNGAQVSASALGEGQGGNLTVVASDSVELIGGALNGSSSGFFTQTQGSGNAGNLTITTEKLVVQDGSQVSASTLSKGRGGKLTVTASDSVEITGRGTRADGSQFPSGFFTDTDGSGAAGNLRIETGKLIVQDGAEVSASTTSKGQAGTLSVTASESVELTGALVDGQLRGSLRTSTGPDATGRGGDLKIETGQLVVQDGAQVTVSARGASNAGNLEATVRSIQLDNQGKLIAETASGEGGNIKLQVRDLLLMRNNSLISAEAGGTGDGGNIKINADFIAASASENSDIIANAFEGQGGNIQITAQGIFGTQFREELTSQSDINASSEIGVDGVVEINTRNVDMQNSLTLLSANFISPEQVVAGSCLARRNAEQGSFTVTGTGGLPRSPYEAISGRYNVTGVQPIQGSSSVSKDAEVVESTTWKKGDPIQEAQGMVVTADGRTIVGTNPQLASLAKAQNLICHSK